MVDVPPAAAIEPENVQVTVPTGELPEFGMHVHPAPVADTKSNPVGIASETVAVVAAPVPELVVVMV